jgi:death-on-curing protein
MAFHIAENQPFVDGNKRAALGTALLFLDLNGVELNDAEGKLYQAMIDISSKTLTKSGLTDLLKKLVGETAEESSS